MAIYKSALFPLTFILSVSSALASSPPEFPSFSEPTPIAAANTPSSVTIPSFITTAPSIPLLGPHDLLRRQGGEELGCVNLCGADGGTTFSCAYFGGGYGICCPTSTFCEPRTACVAYTDHTVSGLTGPSINSLQTMLCGSGSPVCYTGTWEHGVSFGSDLTMAHCVEAGRATSEFFGCSRWTSSAYCMGSATTTSSEDSTISTSTSSETSSTPTDDPSESETERDPTDAESSETDTSDPESSEIGEGGSSGGLSTGAVAGIAAGTGLGCIALAIIAFLIWRNKHNKKKEAAAAAAAAGYVNSPGTGGPMAQSGGPLPPPVGYFPPPQPQMGYGPPPIGYQQPGPVHTQPYGHMGMGPPGQHNSFYEPVRGQAGYNGGASPVMNPADPQKTFYNELPTENGR